MKEEEREGGKRGGRMGRGFLTEPGAVTVRKDFYAVFRETLRPRRDFISQSAGTGKGRRRLFPEKCSEEGASGGKGKKAHSEGRQR